MRFVVALLVALILAAPSSAQQVNIMAPLSALGVGAGLQSAGGNLATKGISGVLCSIRSANFNITTDQACTIPATITAWVPSSIVVTNCSTSMTLAAGGVYPTTSKGGTALVSAVQLYSALTSATIVLNLTLVANIATTRYTANTMYLSLTTGQGGAATCDLYIMGSDLT